MTKITFNVKGSSPQPYLVIFIKSSDNNLYASCTCAAGKNGQYCKHRIKLMSGETSGIVSTNLEDVYTIQAWLIGTDTENALIRMRTLEYEEIRIKNDLKLAKRDLAKFMQY